MADNTWKFLEHQESNPEALKQAVDTLIGYTKKKGFAGAENAQLDSLELVKHVIICEAAALVKIGLMVFAVMDSRTGGLGGEVLVFPALAMMFLWGREIGLREARQEAEAIEDNGGEY